MDLNKAMIIGNVTRDPELRTTATGQTVCTFGIATNMQWTDAQGQKQQRTEFHNVVAWGKLAEICGQYVGKGRKTYIEGRLQTREWEAPDGQKRNRTEIVADNMILLDRKDPNAAPATRIPQPASSSPAPQPPQASAASAIAEAPAAQALDRGVSDQEIRLEDIPF